MLQEVKGSNRAWCLHSVPWKDGEMEKGKERARAPGSAQLTTISSQQAVEGSFPVIPKKTSSVPTCCLNEISYLPKRSHCLITLEQETKGDSGSQRTEILLTLSLLLCSLPSRLQSICTGFLFRAMTAGRQVKTIDSTFQSPHQAASASLTSLCRIRKCFLSGYDAYQPVNHHKLLGKGFEKGDVTITCVLFCPLAYCCNLSITL